MAIVAPVLGFTPKSHIHSLTRCKNQVCDMELACEECRDWPLPKRKVFVNYNNRLRMKREYKQRQARLAGATSDQYVYETDTDVPLDEPSVPVQNVHLDALGQQQCLVSEEVIVSAGTSTEAAPSDLLLLPAGDSLDKLALSIFSRLSNLQSARGPQPPVQSQPVASGISQQGVILPNVCQPSVQSHSAGSGISQQGIILPNVCQPSVQSHSAGSGISQPGVILPNVCQPVFADTEVAGVTAPPPLFPNPVQAVFRLPTAPISGETPHRPVASDQGVQHLQEALVSTRQAITSLRASGVRPHQSLLDSASSLARNLQDARLSSSRPGVSSSAKPTSAQVGPARPEFDPAVPGPSRRRSFDSPQRSSDHSSRQGSDTPPRKRRRLSGNSSEDEDPSSQNRQ